MSKIEDTVCRKIQSRAEFGLNKYGVTLERTDLNRLSWLIHAQEEAMDLANYLEVLIQKESVSIAEAELRKHKEKKKGSLTSLEKFLTFHKPKRLINVPQR